MDHRRSTAGRLAVLAAATLLVLAACGATASRPGYGAKSTSAVTAAAPAGSPTASSAAAAGTVTAATSASAGAYLAGKGGLTLYTFKEDTGTTSSCYGPCATAWPPFIVEAGTSVTGGPGVSGTFGTTARTDGATQVTYKGAPLYYFGGDAKAGDTNGQGLNGVWFVAAP
jgi:predicted lipoprotein with Yx(FWY)xxD motif